MLILIHFNTLINLYYSLVYPFLIYGLIVWGSTYTLNPLYLLQKRALRIMTFSKFDDHSSPLFKQTKMACRFYLFQKHLYIHNLSLTKNIKDVEEPLGVQNNLKLKAANVTPISYCGWDELA